MKTLKRIAAFILAVLLMSAFASAAFADSTGSITVNGVVKGQTYSIYRIFDLESYNQNTGAYAYKINNAWTAFAQDTAAKNYFSADSQGYITWLKDINSAEDTAAFAKLAKDYAKNHSIAAVDAKTAGDTDTTLVFSSLDLGYYLVDSSLGALCALNTTDTAAVVHEKNGEPTIIKETKTENTDAYGTENHIKIGDTVSFRTTINAKPGAENYVMHDTMTEGLTFKAITSVEYISSDTNQTAVLPLSDYTIETNPTDKCTFDLTFSKNFLDTIKKDTPIYVYYTAQLNEKAAYGEGLSNDNTASLSYGDNSRTVSSTTKTYTYMFELIKTNDSGKILTGAKFQLLDKDKNVISLVKDTDSENTYRLATPEEKATAGFVSAEIEAGNCYIAGLNAGTYYISEITPPVGYNKLSEPYKFTMSNSDNEATYNMTVTPFTYVDGGVRIINKTGTVLPQTGGFGTTIFYIAGISLITAALILMVAKKRTGNK